MLRKETVPANLINTLNDLMDISSIQEFRLVGGTALSLQLGHRISVDIDLFSFNANVQFKQIEKELIQKFQQKNIFETTYFKHGISTIINNIKIDIFNWESDFIREIIREENIRLASLEDIIAMKLKTIGDVYGGRYEKKDYFDVACLMKLYDFETMLGFYKERYPHDSERNVVERIKETFRVENKPQPEILNGMSWEDAKIIIAESVDKYVNESIEKIKKKNTH